MDLSSPPLSSDHHAPPNRQRPEKTCGTPRPPGPRPSGPATAGPPTTWQPTWPRCSRSRPESGPQQSHRLLNRSGNRIFTAHRRKGPDMRRPARPERLRPRTPIATGPGPPIAPTPDPHRKLPPFQTISRASRSRSRMTWWSSTSITLVRLPVLIYSPPLRFRQGTTQVTVVPPPSPSDCTSRTPPILPASARMFLNPWPLAS